MKIISERKHIVEVKYYREFNYKDEPGTGFIFECTKDGKLLTDSEDARKNYQSCLSGQVDVIDLGIVERKHHHIEPRIGICEVCGREVYLHRFTNTCDYCGVDYNIQGVRLAQREEWGWETGESINDILSVDIDT